MKNKPCFVFDTNCLVSIALLPISVNKTAFQKAEQIGKIVFSTETIIEFTSVLLRSKFDKYLPVEDRLEFIKRIENRYEKIEIVSSFTDCRDPKDNMFLNLAVDASADYLISGDKDLLILNPFHNIPIITAGDFVRL